MNKKTLKALKTVLREQRLEREKLIGKPRSKSWGGKKSSREERRDIKKQLRNEE